MVIRHLVLISLFVALLASACGPTATAAPTTIPQPSVDLSGIKTYLLDKATALEASTGQLQTVSGRYYQLAQATNFDYATLWQNQPDEVKSAIEEARAAWITASPLYEQMEGIVAGTPSLADFDVILDAGTSAAEDPAGAAPYDLTLPDGRVLEKPGNLFGVTESTLWGTYADFTVPNLQPDFDGNGQADFGEALPDANVLKAGADTLHQYSVELLAAAQKWEPTPSDAFTALVVMVPTMSEYFNSWKSSRFVAGEASEQRDFVAISRLADIQGILSGLQVVYEGVRPLVVTTDSAQAEQIANGLSDLIAFVADVYAKEQSGQRFTPEEADLLGAEAQNRATAITGQITQVAARLNITIEE